MNQKLIEYATTMEMGIFAKRNTLKEAYGFACKLIETLRPADKIAAYTALHVTMNTIAGDVKEIAGAEKDLLICSRCEARVKYTYHVGGLWLCGDCAITRAKPTIAVHKSEAAQ